jgi:hypothetical protein
MLRITVIAIVFFVAGCVTDSSEYTQNIAMTLSVDSSGRDTVDDMVSLDY